MNARHAAILWQQYIASKLMAQRYIVRPFSLRVISGAGGPGDYGSTAIGGCNRAVNPMWPRAALLVG